MNFDFLISSANDELQKRYAGGTPPSMGDTICLICSENGTVYKGYNNKMPNGDNIHAEVAAVNSLRADGQSMIRAITVFDSFNRVPIIPCNGCLQMLLSIDYRNINTVIVTPTGVIPITNFLGHNNGMNSGQTMMNSGMNNGMMNNGMPNSGMMNNGMQRGASTYMNPNTSGYMNNPAMNQPAYRGNSVQMSGQINGSMNNSVYMNSVNSVTTSIGSKAYTAGNSGKSSALKNKLNDLLNDDDDDED
jgi:cytidine deaminase